MKVNALRYRNKIAAMIVRAVDRQDQGFLFDTASAVAWKCAFIDKGGKWETYCNEEQRDYTVMLQLIKDRQ